MCLYVKTKSQSLKKAIELNKRIAKTDIIVYKRFRGPNKWSNQYGSGISLKSPYRRYNYEVGFHYYNEGDLKQRFGFTINFAGNEMSIHRGLHAYTTPKVAKQYLGAKDSIFECIVPKGSTYYLGRDNEICTDNLIITDTVVY